MCGHNLVFGQLIVPNELYQFKARAQALAHGRVAGCQGLKGLGLYHYGFSGGGILYLMCLALAGAGGSVSELSCTTYDLHLCGVRVQHNHSSVLQLRLRITDCLWDCMELFSL